MKITIKHITTILGIASITSCGHNFQANKIANYELDTDFMINPSVKSEVKEQIKDKVKSNELSLYKISTFKSKPNFIKQQVQDQILLRSDLIQNNKKVVSTIYNTKLGLYMKETKTHPVVPKLYTDRSQILINHLIDTNYKERHYILKHKNRIKTFLDKFQITQVTLINKSTKKYKNLVIKDVHSLSSIEFVKTKKHDTFVITPF